MFYVCPCRLILFNRIVFYCVGKADMGRPVYFTLASYEYLFGLYLVFYFANSNSIVVYTCMCHMSLCTL